MHWVAMGCFVVLGLFWIAFGLFWPVLGCGGLLVLLWVSLGCFELCLEVCTVLGRFALLWAVL